MRGTLSPKIINDPVHGFITVPSGLSRLIVDHPTLQRLRHIRQLGQTHLVYPGAQHTRFQHALGAMHLMQLALQTLRQKGHHITQAEEESALAATLLHDAGHTPLSHCLERHLLTNITHEEMSLALMQEIDRETGGQLGETIEIFTNKHQKKFLHQLLASQLDVDRMDYLLRDSFFTGVVEGRIPDGRLLKMLDIHNESLAIEIKGIHSVENFLLARRVMYWQVYLHKTVVTADLLLQALIKRAREIAQSREPLNAPAPLLYLLQNDPTRDALNSPENRKQLLCAFLALDDTDIHYAMKSWTAHSDPTLSHLAQSLTSRLLPRLTFTRETLTDEQLHQLRTIYKKQHPRIPDALLQTVIQTGQATNRAYNLTQPQIQLTTPQRQLIPLTLASQIITPQLLERADTRPYYLVPKELSGEAGKLAQR